MMQTIKALKNEPLGGNIETLYMLMVAAGLMSAFPPMSQWIDDTASSVRLATRLGLMAAGAFGSYKLAYSTLKKQRREFALHSSFNIESSDPLKYDSKTSGLIFGYTTDTGSPLFVSDEDLCRHGLIEGQTGVGKTVLGKLLMFQQIQRGGGLLFVDGKLDEDNIQDIYEFAVYCGRGNDFLVVNPGNPAKSNTYNPILFGDPDEVAARIISLIPNTASSAGADYYKQSANLALVCFISALQEESPAQVEAWIKESKGKGFPEGHVDNNRVKGRAYNFLDLALLTMNEGVLNNLMQTVQHNSPDSLTRKNLTIFLEQYAKENSADAEVGIVQIDLKRLKETLGGIGARMHQFGSGNFGPVLNSYAPEVRIYDAIRDNKIVYVALPTMGKDVAAQNLGKIVIADLRTAISWLQLNKADRPKIPFLVFMDEMSSYSTETLAVMFEQARSARVALFPAIQTDSGLSNISEDFKERIFANTELKVFFKISSDETALAASELIGATKRILESNSAGTGISASAQALDLGPNKSMSDSANSSKGESENEEPLVSKDAIKALEIGECVVLRSPRVWNIRIPVIELDSETKKAIGPLRINHGKSYVKQSESFNAIGNVDAFIRDAQKRRVKPKKDKGAPGAAYARPEAGSGGTGSVEALVQNDMPSGSED
jgi:hypothetical protein